MKPPRPELKPKAEAPKAWGAAASNTTKHVSHISGSEVSGGDTSRPSQRPRRSVPPPGPVVGRVIAGKFRLERELKHGGMGAVWVAKHLGLGVPVAIKFMTAGLDLLAEKRFAREAKTAAQIRSTNVVHMLDYGVDEGLAYIVMELLEGEDLAARIKRVKRLSPAELFPILQAIARGLARAHEAGLVHRDLKPENVFLAKDGEDEIPKILDFGIAKQAADDPDAGTITKEGTLLGSPQYMSPEQARGKDLDFRSDLWSLGVIAFRALTGRLLFAKAPMGDFIVQICTAPLPKATAYAPDLPPALDGFFERALSRDPNERFQSARELVTAFAKASGLETGAPRESLVDFTPSRDQVAPPEPERPLVLPKARPSVFREVLLAAAAALVVILAGGAWLLLRSSPRKTAEAPATTSAGAVLSDAAPVASAGPATSARATPSGHATSSVADPPDSRAEPSASATKARPSEPQKEKERDRETKRPRRDVGY